MAGPDLLIEPESIAQVAAAVCLVRDSGLPLLVIGQGTNLLFDDCRCSRCGPETGRELLFGYQV